jgi:hypothetical protein
MPFITTENKLRHLVVMTPKKLDIGVAGLEFLSGSRDLLSLPERMPLEFATQLTLEKIKAQRRWSPRPMRHEQALPTQQLANPAIAGTSAFVDVAFHQTHVKGDRETALTDLVVLKCCGKELIESFFTLILSLGLRLSVD